MATGEVKCLIMQRDGDLLFLKVAETIFLFIFAIQGTGYKTLLPGQQVNYDVQKGERGLHANSVVVLGEAAE